MVIQGPDHQASAQQWFKPSDDQRLVGGSWIAPQSGEFGKRLPLLAARRAANKCSFASWQVSAKGGTTRFRKVGASCGRQARAEGPGA